MQREGSQCPFTVESASALRGNALPRFLITIFANVQRLVGDINVQEPIVTVANRPIQFSFGRFKKTFKVIL